MLTLIVKGTAVEAAMSAIRHGFGQIVIAKRGDEDCVIKAHGSMDLAAEWFCEPERAPFPPGTLLYYKEAL